MSSISNVISKTGQKLTDLVKPIKSLIIAAPLIASLSACSVLNASSQQKFDDPIYFIPSAKTIVMPKSTKQTLDNKLVFDTIYSDSSDLDVDVFVFDNFNRLSYLNYSSNDFDNDGIVDFADPMPYDYGPYIDVNNNGVIDRADIYIRPNIGFRFYDNYYGGYLGSHWHNYGFYNSWDFGFGFGYYNYGYNGWNNWNHNSYYFGDNNYNHNGSGNNYSSGSRRESYNKKRDGTDGGFNRPRTTPKNNLKDVVSPNTKRSDNNSNGNVFNNRSSNEDKVYRRDNATRTNANENTRTRLYNPNVRLGNGSNSIDSRVSTPKGNDNSYIVPNDGTRIRSRVLPNNNTEGRYNSTTPSRNNESTYTVPSTRSSRSATGSENNSYQKNTDSRTNNYQRGTTPTRTENNYRNVPQQNTWSAPQQNNTQQNSYRSAPQQNFAPQPSYNSGSNNSGGSNSGSGSTGTRSSGGGRQQ